MSWKSANTLLHARTVSLEKRLTFFYTLSTIALLTVIALIFFPSLVRTLSKFNQQNYPSLTVECIKQILLMLLCGSVCAMILGHLIAKRGLNKIRELQQTMVRISADALDERLDLRNWPVELNPLGVQFNHMLDRLQQAFVQLAQFSSNIAHELRHPIHHLMQMTELALSNRNLDPAAQELLVSHMKEFRDLSTLVEQLLFIARSEHAQISLNKERIHLSAFIHTIFEYYQAWADEKNITLSCSGDAEFNADPVLLQRAFCNLCANALQYTQEGGAITVNVTVTSRSQVLIEFCDNGPGIDADHLPHVFQRFYQVDAARSQSGTFGLGLPIVKSIVTLHGASVSIQSKSNGGTTVSVLFPN